METLQLPCATCARAGSLSQQCWVAHSGEENIGPVVKGQLLLPKLLEPQELQWIFYDEWDIFLVSAGNYGSAGDKLIIRYLYLRK